MNKYRFVFHLGRLYHGGLAAVPRLRKASLLFFALAALMWSTPWTQAATIELVAPVAGDTNVVSAPALSVFVADTAETNLTATFYWRPTPAPPGPNFTIIALPDTQFYSASVNGGTPEMFGMQIEWIITNRVERNIVFVTHLGDCVNNGEYEDQWLLATNAMYRLENPVTTLLDHGIPYGIAPGNHDLYWPFLDSFYFYNKYFGVPHFGGKSYYSGHYGSNNDNHYEFISVSGLDLMFLHLQWDAGQNTNLMAWANDVLQQNRHRRAIVVTHSLLNGSTAQFNAQGQPIFDALKANTNIFLMLGGHHPEAQSRSDTFAGNTIRSLVSDYTNLTNGGGGYLRIMEFSPSNGTMRVQTYSPFLDEFLTKVRSDFTLSDFDLIPAAQAFSPFEVVSNASPGLISSSPLTTLLASTSYEWYVAVADGETNYSSAPRTFRTSADYPGNTPPAPVTPFIFRTLAQADGHVTILWTSVGAGRYRVEFKNSADQDFIEIIRPPSEEIDPSAPGTPSVQAFTDDFSLTGGSPPDGARFYRIRRLE